MSHLARLRGELPPLFTAEPDSIISALLDAIALELDAFQEDLDRYQRSHRVRSVYRLSDLEKMAALLGIDRLPWEQLDMFRERLLALVAELLDGATGPRQIRRFVENYLRRAESVLESTFVPGLRDLDPGEAYQSPPGRPLFRPLRLVENPERTRTSEALRAVDGRVPYLHRWKESNTGLGETIATFNVTGVAGGTAVPVFANLTGGDLIGYAGTLGFGQTLRLGEVGPSSPGSPRLARALVDDRDVSADLFSLGGLVPGVPFSKADLDPRPLLPRLLRGPNDWVFLALGLYDIKGLDRTFFALADNDLREGVFDRTGFDNALFPGGTKAVVEMGWVETEPASFEVRVPRHLVAEPGGAGADGVPNHEHVAEGLRSAVGVLHATGVRAVVVFEPFAEEQRQRVRFRLGLKTLEPETGTAGTADSLSLGGRFGESPLGGSRFD